MSPKLPRDVDGQRLANVLCSRFGYAVRAQAGSHILLQHGVAGGHLSVPNHKPVRVGTFANILSDFEQQTGVSRDELLRKL